MEEKDFQYFSEGLYDDPKKMTHLQNNFLIDLRKDLVSGFKSINDELSDVKERLERLEYVPVVDEGVETLMKLSDFTIKVNNQVNLMQTEIELKNQTRKAIKDGIASVNWWGKNILQIIQMVIILIVLLIYFTTPKIDEDTLNKIERIYEKLPE